jgi:hypothetical protein
MKKIILFAISACLLSGVFAQDAGDVRTKNEDPEATTLSKASLAATWRAGNEEYTFDKNGTSVYKIGEKECPGSWLLKGKTLTINPKKLMWRKSDPCSKTRVFEVTGFAASDLTLTETAAGKTVHFTKKK